MFLKKGKAKKGDEEVRFPAVALPSSLCRLTLPRTPMRTKRRSLLVRNAAARQRRKPSTTKTMMKNPPPRKPAAPEKPSTKTPMRPRLRRKAEAARRKLLLSMALLTRKKKSPRLRREAGAVRASLTPLSLLPRKLSRRRNEAEAALRRWFLLIALLTRTRTKSSRSRRRARAGVGRRRALLSLRRARTTTSELTLLHRLTASGLSEPIRCSSSMESFPIRVPPPTPSQVSSFYARSTDLRANFDKPNAPFLLSFRLRLILPRSKTGAGDHRKAQVQMGREHASLLESVSILSEHPKSEHRRKSMMNQYF